MVGGIFCFIDLWSYFTAITNLTFLLTTTRRLLQAMSDKNVNEICLQWIPTEYPLTVASCGQL